MLIIGFFRLPKYSLTDGFIWSEFSINKLEADHLIAASYAVVVFGVLGYHLEITKHRAGYLLIVRNYFFKNLRFVSMM